MNKVIKTIASVALLAIGGYAAYSATAEPEMTELQKANLEALARKTSDNTITSFPRLPAAGNGNCFLDGGDCHMDVEAIIVGSLPTAP